MRLAIVMMVALRAGEAAAQTCPALAPSCPGSTTTSCGRSACDDSVTFTRLSACDDAGTVTSCFVRSSSGQSCSCLEGPCVIDFGECPSTTGCGGSEPQTQGPQLGVGCKCSAGAFSELLVAAAVLRAWASAARRSRCPTSRPASRGRG